MCSAKSADTPVANSVGTGRLSLWLPRSTQKPPSPGLWSVSCTDTASSEVHISPPTHRYCSSGLKRPNGTPSSPEMGPPCKLKPSESQLHHGMLMLVQQMQTGYSLNWEKMHFDHALASNLSSKLRPRTSWPLSSAIARSDSSMEAKRTKA